MRATILALLFLIPGCAPWVAPPGALAAAAVAAACGWTAG